MLFVINTHLFLLPPAIQVVNLHQELSAPRQLCHTEKPLMAAADGNFEMPMGLKKDNKNVSELSAGEKHQIDGLKSSVYPTKRGTLWAVAGKTFCSPTCCPLLIFLPLHCWVISWCKSAHICQSTPPKNQALGVRDHSRLDLFATGTQV